MVWRISGIILHLLAISIAFNDVNANAPPDSPPSDKEICTYVPKKKPGSNDIDRQVPFCSFFDNRAPKPNHDLRNCSWFRDCACCQQIEIDHLFSSLRPLPGANRECLAYLNMLICYICAPNQFLFYSRERLTVCASFCKDLYESCRDAVLKGSPIKKLYSDGTRFCESRGFTVTNGTSDCYQGVLSFDSHRKQALSLVDDAAKRGKTSTCRAVATTSFLFVSIVLLITQTLRVF